MDVASPITVAGVAFRNALLNGAYIGSKSLDDIKVLAESKVGAIVVGSITVKPRDPNPSGGYWLHKERFYSLNSFGMPNGGIPYFVDVLPRMAKIAHDAGKPLIANVAGFTSEEYATLAELAVNSGVDLVELNFGCPNVWDDGGQKRILSYHAQLMHNTLEYIDARKFKTKFTVKLSPLPPDILREVAKVLAGFNLVGAVTVSNSYPNASLSTGTRKDQEEGDLLAGFAGRALKPLSIGMVRQLHELLPPRIDIIGCGGVSTASDVRDYLGAGAKAVQIATALVDDGPSVFAKILFQAKSR